MALAVHDVISISIGSPTGKRFGVSDKGGPLLVLCARGEPRHSHHGTHAVIPPRTRTLGDARPSTLDAARRTTVQLLPSLPAHQSCGGNSPRSWLPPFAAVVCSGTVPGGAGGRGCGNRSGAGGVFDQPVHPLGPGVGDIRFRGSRAPRATRRRWSAPGW